MSIPNKIPEDIYKRIIKKIQKIAEEEPANIVQCFNSVTNRIPTPEELEGILLYLNKDNLPQA